jgi:hypothetical protein
MQCRRCGDCCKNCKIDFWKDAKLTNNPLFEAMKKYLTNLQRCPFLGKDKHNYVCIIEIAYGKESKPEICQQYFCNIV